MSQALIKVTIFLLALGVAAPSWGEHPAKSLMRLSNVGSQPGDFKQEATAERQGPRQLEALLPEWLDDLLASGPETLQAPPATAQVQPAPSAQPSSPLQPPASVAPADFGATRRPGGTYRFCATPRCGRTCHISATLRASRAYSFCARSRGRMNLPHWCNPPPRWDLSRLCNPPLQWGLQLLRNPPLRPNLSRLCNPRLQWGLQLQYTPPRRMNLPHWCNLPLPRSLPLRCNQAPSRLKRPGRQRVTILHFRAPGRSLPFTRLRPLKARAYGPRRACRRTLRENLLCIGPCTGPAWTTPTPSFTWRCSI